MIPGDEGQPMTIMERISDEPCEVEPYLEYILDYHRRHREYWKSLPNDREGPTARECVAVHLGIFIVEIEAALMKLRRERSKEKP